MKIRNEAKFEHEKEFKVGDLFEIELDWLGETNTSFIYQLVDIYGEYMLMRFDDNTKNYHFYNGKHSSIEELFDKFDKNTQILAHYPSDEYELVLTKK